ncbi:MAG: flavodoxin [Clostridiales bacterium]|nr:flavodoxin [Clostridiales bacterium]
MKTIIVYTSQTGFTEKYAKLLGERLKGEVLTLKEAKKKPKDYFDDADAIIYGGWAMAGKVSGVSWFTKKIDNWKGKKLACFCVGASPIDAPDVGPCMDKVFNDEQKKFAKTFYCQGGLCYAKMSGPSRMAMKAFASMLAKRKNQTEDQKLMAKMVAQDYDISDPKFIDPIVAFVEG